MPSLQHKHRRAALMTLPLAYSFWLLYIMMACNTYTDLQALQSSSSVADVSSSSSSISSSSSSRSTTAAMTSTVLADGNEAVSQLEKKPISDQLQQQYPPPPTSTTRRLPQSHHQHVVFTTYKCGLANVTCSDVRRAAENNSRLQWQRITPHFLDFSDDKTIGYNEFHVPVLPSMFVRAQQVHPNAETYTYVNGDILPSLDFFRTANAWLDSYPEQWQRREAPSKSALSDTISLWSPPLTKFVMIGKRYNVKWSMEYNVDDFHNLVQSRGRQANDITLDYFIVSRNAMDWAHVPPMVIGRIAWDTFMADTAHHHPNMDLIDTTNTNPVIHQTDEQGNTAWGGNMIKFGKQDKFYNRQFTFNRMDHGSTIFADYESFYSKQDDAEHEHDNEGEKDGRDAAAAGVVPRSETNRASIHFRYTSQRWTVVVAVATGQHGLFDNWLYHFELLRLYEVSLVILCRDERTWQVYDERFHHNSTLRKRYGGWQIRLGTLDLFEELGRASPMVYSDVRTVWLANPFLYLDAGYDMWLTRADDDDSSTSNTSEKNTTSMSDDDNADDAAYNQPNTTVFDLGFVAFARTPAILQLLANKPWDVWRRPYVKASEIFDALSSVSSMARPPRVKILPRQEFPTPKQFFVQNARNGTVVARSTDVSETKALKRRLQGNNLWN